MNSLYKWLRKWKPIHLCWLFEKHGWTIPKYFIGGGYADPQYEGSRISDGVRAWEADEDLDVTDWVVGEDFCVSAAYGSQVGSKGSSLDLRLRWRNVSDGGSFAELGSSGQLTYSADTDLVNDNGLTEVESGCLASQSTYVAGVEREGANSVTSATLGEDEWSATMWAVDTDNALAGKQYEFEVYDQVGATQLFLCSAQITMAAAGGDQEDWPHIYLDASAGGGGDGSQSLPYDGFGDINWTTGGDNSVFDYYAGTPSESLTINLKRGETWLASWFISAASGSAQYPILIRPYDTGNNPIIDCEDTRSYGLRIREHSYFDVSDIDVKNSTGDGIQVYDNDAAGQPSNIRFYRVSSLDNAARGFDINGDATFGDVTYIQLYDCIATGNGTDAMRFAITDNCKIDGGNYSNSDQYGAYLYDADNTEIYRGLFDGNVSDGLKLDFNSINCTVKYNQISNNTDDDGMSVINLSTGAEVAYNLFFGNNTAAGTPSQVAGLQLREADNAKVYNNVFYNNTGVGLRISQTDSPTVKNNISSANGETEYDLVDDGDASSITADYNCYNGALGGVWGTYAGSNTISADPLMVNPGSEDFRLQPASPCIDTGTDVGLKKDYTGNIVPEGRAVDMGAYERYLSRVMVI